MPYRLSGPYPGPCPRNTAAPLSSDGAIGSVFAQLPAKSANRPPAPGMGVLVSATVVKVNRGSVAAAARGLRTTRAETSAAGTAQRVREANMTTSRIGGEWIM